MSNYLRQSTAASIVLGPFVDDTNGYTPETSLAIISASVYLSKNGTNLVAKNSNATASHLTLGYYQTLLDTTDTNNAGDLLVVTSPSGALPVWRNFTVLTGSVYDSLITGASYLPTNLELYRGTLAATPDTAGVPRVSITASGINASAIMASAIYTGAFAASAINNTVFAANAGSVIWNNAVRTVTGGSVVATSGSITVTNMAPSTITASTIGASALDTSNFAMTAASKVWDAAVRGITAVGACAIGTTSIAGSAISAPTIAASTILSTHIRTGAITGDAIAASALSSTKLTTGTIVADTLAASTITNVNFALTAGSQVWNSAVRTVTGGSVVATSGSVVTTTNLDKTNYVLAASSIAASTIAANAINNTVLAASTLNNINMATTAGSVIWDAAVRNITGGSVVATSGSVVVTTNLDKTGYILGASSIAASTLAASAIDNNSLALTGASQVWNASVRTITGGSINTNNDKLDYSLSGSALFEISASTGGSSGGATAADVWAYANRTITGGSVVATSGSVIATTVLDKTNYILAASSIAASTIAANAIYNTAIAASAINNTNFALTAASQVWDAGIRTVTGGSVVATSGSVVALSGSVVATSGSVVVTANLDKTNYILAASSLSSSTLAASAIDNNSFSLTAGSQIWNSAVRTITGGTITANNDKLNYGLSGSALGEISASISGSTSGGGATAADIWAYTPRTLTTSISGVMGAGSETVIITCNDGTNPLEGVAVWVTTDVAGTDIKAGTVYSDTLGKVTVYLDPGTYQVWKQGQVNWTNPTTIVVTDA